MDISKEELLAYTEAATKTATALEKIADRLIDISAQQKNCHEKFCGSMLELIKTNHELLLHIDQKTNDVGIIKWVTISLMSVVGLGWIILQIFHHNAG